ncbi:Uncharacterised protein [Mycobacteroides abscessus]|nr:Uncharacterised protein [Mycobacteroides abscessus]
MHRMEGQVRLPGVQVGGGEQPVERREELGLGKRERPVRRRTLRLQIGAPFEMGCHRVGLRDGDQFVLIGRITLLHRAQCRCGQGGFQRRHLLGTRLGQLLVGSDQTERRRDVGAVGVEYRRVPRIGVVVLGGHAQRIGTDVADLLGGIRVVGAGLQPEYQVLPGGAVRGQEGGKLLGRLDLIDRGEGGANGVVSGGVQLRVVGGSPVQQPHLIVDRLMIGGTETRDRAVDDLMLNLAGLIVQHVEAAVAGLVRGNGGLGDPLGVDKPIEVGARGKTHAQLGVVERRNGCVRGHLRGGLVTGTPRDGDGQH